MSDFPSVNEEAIDVNLEEKMQSVLQIVELTRSIRNQVAIKTKQPLSKLTVVTSSGHRLEGLDEYSEIIADETNMKQIQFETSLQDYVTYELKLNFPRKLEVMGMVCPFPLVEAKKEIEEMTSGEELVINFDCTQATESIPRWAAESGHTVTNYEEVGEAAWTITVKKK